MKLIFLKNIYYLYEGNNKVLYASLIESMENSFIYKSKVVNMETLGKICNEYLTDDNLEIDFYYSESTGLECHDVPCIEVSLEDIKMMLKEEQVYRPITDKTIYSLFLSLVEDEALFVPDIYVGDEAEDVKLSNLHDFIPRVSQGTLTVCFSYIFDKKWKTKKLIYDEDNNIVSEEFSVAVKENLAEKYKNEFGLIQVGDFMCDEVKYIILTYKRNLSIYTYLESNIPYFKPFIVRYITKRTAEGYVIKTFNALLSNLLKTEEIVTEGRSSGRVIGRNIGFTLLEEKIKIKELCSLVVDVTKTIIPMLDSGEITYDKIQSEILEDSNLDYMKRCVYASLLDVLYKQTTPIVPTLLSAVRSCKANQLLYDLIVYSIRIALIQVGGVQNREVLEGSDLGYMVRVVCK